VANRIEMVLDVSILLLGAGAFTLLEHRRCEVAEPPAPHAVTCVVEIPATDVQVRRVFVQARGVWAEVNGPGATSRLVRIAGPDGVPPRERELDPVGQSPDGRFKAEVVRADPALVDPKCEVQEDFAHEKEDDRQGGLLYPSGRPKTLHGYVDAWSADSRFALMPIRCGRYAQVLGSVRKWSEALIDLRARRVAYTWNDDSPRPQPRAFVALAEGGDAVVVRDARETTFLTKVNGQWQARRVGDRCDEVGLSECVAAAFASRVAFAPHTSTLAVGHRDGHWCVLPSSDVPACRTLATPGAITSLVWSNDGARLAIGASSGTVEIVDASTYETTDLYNTFGRAPLQIAWLDDRVVVAEADKVSSIKPKGGGQLSWVPVRVEGGSGDEIAFLAFRDGLVDGDARGVAKLSARCEGSSTLVPIAEAEARTGRALRRPGLATEQMGY
jgi:hypothetical protein